MLHVQILVVNTSVYKLLVDHSAFVKMVFRLIRKRIQRAWTSTNARRICALNNAKIPTARSNALVTLHTIFYGLTIFLVKPEVGFDTC